MERREAAMVSQAIGDATGDVSAVRPRGDSQEWVGDSQRPLSRKQMQRLFETARERRESGPTGRAAGARGCGGGLIRFRVGHNLPARASHPWWGLEE